MGLSRAGRGNLTRSHPGGSARRPFLNRLRLAGQDGRLLAAADKLHDDRNILKGYRLLETGNLATIAEDKREGMHWYYRALAEELYKENNWGLGDWKAQFVAQAAGRVRPKLVRNEDVGGE